MKEEKALEKIQKCLRLAKSSNANEAAAALRQAQKLMEKYGFTEQDVDLASVKSSEHSAGTAQKPARWHHMLVTLICDAFGVEAIYVVRYSGTKIEFSGIETQAEIAGYAYDVLHRQVKRDRLDHIKLQKRCKKATKTRRGDLFAESWVRGVYSQVTKFAQPEEHKQLIKTWMNKNHPDTVEQKAKQHSSKGNDWKSQMDGYSKGKEAQLNRPMNGDKRERLEAQP